jgi:hypothetical protein
MRNTAGFVPQANPCIDTDNMTIDIIMLLLFVPVNHGSNVGHCVPRRTV